jgi:hypothetical protein
MLFDEKLVNLNGIAMEKKSYKKASLLNGGEIHPTSHNDIPG